MQQLTSLSLSEEIVEEDEPEEDEEDEDELESCDEIRGYGSTPYALT